LDFITDNDFRIKGAYGIKQAKVVDDGPNSWPHDASIRILLVIMQLQVSVSMTNYLSL
jgi:hypothetical protein